MSDAFPALWVDHVSIAVRDIAPALALLRRHLPIRMNAEPQAGYDDQFRWTDFFIGDWKLELIESARAGSFVETFLARRGEGFHHLSIDVAEGALDPYVSTLQRHGLHLVERSDYPDGSATTFISPRTAPGILVQYWQVPGFRGGRMAGVPADPVAERDGVRFRVDHVALAVQSIDATLAWFRRAFPVTTASGPVVGWDGTHRLQTFRLAGFKMELLEPVGSGGPIARALAARGEGFHHLTIDVDRLDPVLERFQDDGVRVVGRTELRGGQRTAFLHPHDVHGVLLQLWEQPEFGGPRRD